MQTMWESGMQRVLRELVSQNWQDTRAACDNDDRVTGGHSWRPGEMHGAMPFLNPEPILQPKDRIPAAQAMGQRTF